MDVGLEIVIVVVDVLIAVEEAEGMLLGEFPVETGLIADLLEAPGVEQLHVGIGGDGEAFLVVLDLQAASEHILACSAVDFLLAVVGAVEAIPALVDGLLGAVGVLPAFAQREAEVADEFLVKVSDTLKRWRGPQ